MKHIAHCTVIFLGFGVVSDIEDTILWYLYFCGKSNGLTELLKICKKYIYIYTNVGFYRDAYAIHHWSFCCTRLSFV
jgi:hypothetical protein